MTKETGYSLTRKFFDFAFENSRIIRPVHVAIYCWCVELNNRLGWKDEFQLPTEDGMSYTGILDRHTFINAVKDLAEWGAIKIIQESKNRFTARYISLKYCNLVINKHVDNSHAISDGYDVKNPPAIPHAIPPAIPHATPTKDKPYKTKETSKPINIPKPSTSDGIYPACMKLYNDFILEKTGVSAKINEKAGSAMKKIISYLKKQVKNQDDLSSAVPGAFEFILTNYNSWLSFHKDQLDLNQIESNLINIINAIKNGKSVAKVQPRSKYAPTS
jgi:hypothetical protein